MIIVVLFVLTGAGIVIAGSFLTKFADDIAERTGLGRVWAGSILLAGATSLPELMTDISAVQLGVPDLAVGDLFGSSMANMLILAIIGMTAQTQRAMESAAPAHTLTASLALVLTSLAAVLLIRPTGVQIYFLSLDSLLIVATYGVGIRTVFLFNVAVPGITTGADQSLLEKRESKRWPAITGFLASAAAILLLAPQFAKSAKGLAAMAGLDSGFVGASLVGLSTSLPELVASLAAMRMGAFDMAVGNLFGSNAFNMVIFVALDAIWPGGSIFGSVSPLHTLTALFAILLTAIGLMSVVYRTEKRFSLIEPSSTLIIVLYVAAMGFLYTQGVHP